MIYTFLLPQDNFVPIECLHNGKVRTCLARSGLHELSQLLRVCGQLRSEAVPILYGSIKYKFKIFRYLVGWLMSIGSMVKHVRMLQVWQWNNVDARTAVAKLQAATCLTAFSLGMEEKRKPITVGAAAFVPLIKRLFESTAEPDIEARAFGILRAIPGSRLARHWGLACTGEIQAAEEYTSALQSELRRRLA